MGQKTPHDRFTYEVFSDKANAVDFFQGVLPDELIQVLDLRSLTEDKTKYTDERLDEYFSDIVYTCRYSGKHQIGHIRDCQGADRHTEVAIKLVLLFEHKSFVPTFPHNQLLRYILNIWNHHIKQRKTIPIVLPIIFYHGKRKWRKRPLSDYLKGETDRFCRFIPGFDYLLVDLSEYSDEQIKTIIFTRTAVKIAMLVQKHIFHLERLREHLNDFLKLGILYFKEYEGLRFLESVCRYIFTATEIEAETIIKTVDVLPQRAEEVVMTTAEKLRKEGQREGQEKTNFEHARKMIEEGLDEKLIMRITGLSQEEVRKLQENM
jgi:predicted transposase/invertase (TIGR01784 family)